MRRLKLRWLRSAELGFGDSVFQSLRTEVGGECEVLYLLFARRDAFRGVNEQDRLARRQVGSGMQRTKSIMGWGGAGRGGVLRHRDVPSLAFSWTSVKQL